MISVYQIKPKFQQLLKPILIRLHQRGVSANQITIASVMLSLLIGISFWFADDNRILFLALPVGLFFRMALNALDGMMARSYHQQTKKGEMLNEMGDVVSDLLIFFPLIKFESDSLYLVVVFICLSMVNEFAGILGKVISQERRYEGPMGKSDRAFMMGIYGLLSFFSIELNGFSLWVFCALNLLLIISTATRIKKSIH